jgi:hypothetical protein
MQRRQFTQALSFNAIAIPLSLSLSACGGGSEDSLNNASTAPGTERNSTALASVREAPAARKVGSYPSERILISPRGEVYTLNRRNKTLSHTQTVIQISPRSPQAMKSSPLDASFDTLGNAYVLDKTLGEVRVYNASGVMERRFGERGAGHQALSSPSAIAVHEEQVLIADSANHRVQIFSLTGIPLSRFGIMKDQAEGFNYPRDIKISPGGHVYVLHGGNSGVTVHDMSGSLLSKHDFSKDAKGQYQNISAIALSASGRLYLSDLHSGRILILSSDGTLAAQDVVSPVKGKVVAARYIALGANDQLYTSGLLPLMS